MRGIDDPSPRAMLIMSAHMWTAIRTPGASNHHFHPTRQRVICFHRPATQPRPATAASTMNAAIIGRRRSPPSAGMANDQLMSRVSSTNSTIRRRAVKALTPRPERYPCPCFHPITAKNHKTPDRLFARRESWCAPQGGHALLARQLHSGPYRWASARTCA